MTSILGTTGGGGEEVAQGGYEYKYNVSVSSGGTTTLFDISGEIKLEQFVLYQDFDDAASNISNSKIKIYIDNTLIFNDWIYHIHTSCGGGQLTSYTNKRLKVYVPIYNDTDKKYVFVFMIPLKAKSSIKIQFYNGSSAGVLLSAHIFYQK